MTADAWALIQARAAARGKVEEIDPIQLEPTLVTILRSGSRRYLREIDRIWPIVHDKACSLGLPMRDAPVIDELAAAGSLDTWEVQLWQLYRRAAEVEETHVHGRRELLIWSVEAWKAFGGNPFEWLARAPIALMQHALMQHPIISE